MSVSILKAAAVAVVAAAALLPTTQSASAKPAIIVTPAAGVGIFMGAGASTMLRAAYVWNTECRYLTFNEAVTGLLPIWPLFHKPDNQCVTTQRITRVKRVRH